MVDYNISRGVVNFVCGRAFSISLEYEGEMVYNRVVRSLVILLALALVAVLGACSLESGQDARVGPNVGEEAIMQLTSTVFAQGQSIPRKYTCDGQDISPPLTWRAAPANTQSFALVMDDPDAPVGVWDHWLIFNIPAAANGLAENVLPEPRLPDGSVQGTNSWGRVGYGGPCPPRGQHRYFFRLYALDTTLNLGPETRKKQLLEAMQGHILAQAELMGVYAR